MSVNLRGKYVLCGLHIHEKQEKEVTFGPQVKYLRIWNNEEFDKKKQFMKLVQVMWVEYLEMFTEK